MKGIGQVVIAAVLAVALPPPSYAQDGAASSTAARRAAIDARLARVEATKAIERLQYAYGYYQDRFFFAEVASLFATKSPSVQWGDDIWRGERAVRAFWLDYLRPVIAGGSDGPVAGKLFDMPQWQGVITIAPDGRRATARFNSTGRYAVYREKEYWISGFFQNRYVREGGVWKIEALKFCPNWSARYTAGWRDAIEGDALAWLPAPPRKAKPTRAARGEERCPAPYPAQGGVGLDFDPIASGEAR